MPLTKDMKRFSQDNLQMRGLHGIGEALFALYRIGFFNTLVNKASGIL